MRTAQGPSDHLGIESAERAGLAADQAFVVHAAVDTTTMSLLPSPLRTCWTDAI